MDCVRNQQKVFETARWYDYPLGFIAAGILSFLGSLIAPKLGFFVFFLAPIAGVIIAEASRFITRRRRSKPLYITITAGALIGALPAAAGNIISFLFYLPQIEFSISLLLSTLWDGAYAIIIASSVYYRISRMTFNR